MSGTFKVKRAEEAEKTQLIELWAALYQWHHNHDDGLIKKPCRSELETEIAEYLNTPDCIVFVVLNDGALSGFITGQLCELASPLTKSELVGSIDHWFVSEEHRGNGLGLALLERIEQEFADYGAKRLNVEVWHFNKNALETYKKRGFQTHIHCMTKVLS
ncbi:GNAT family N-acetyltransferase [Vibrio breoganii]|uniref:GNAT family N-acetyltransferase n=1 Tax=Vibrio breoganii TaxID=553239 RepID=A0AAN0XUN7_9VIBR|nr:GNAT family N-acetyltransferase [Vibrio breoganii]ANO32923.1 GNAT family N-acetyltransferase [Vibrio breoganii]OED87651.1 GNAT family N-acetyltransferase [Vibrio breoganii ZF-55]PMG83039.1 GNAT family N-acetyltransferase [Vibrio breoganii]PMK49200.1 GNAT family N-acetyltransferase [Vibrio breoganii]PML03785.1 GNAT family N-acetyltransferase [Vibrio breoganii]